MAHVWIVEMLGLYSGKWIPVYDRLLESRAEARNRRNEIDKVFNKHKTKYYKFRIKKYVRAE